MGQNLWGNLWGQTLSFSPRKRDAPSSNFLISRSSSMARHARFILPNVPLHIVQRGNNRQPCFFDEVDHRVYLRALETHAKSYSCAVHAYVLMTNHTHILATPSDREGPARMMKALGQNFTEYINRRRGRTGSLWEGRFWSGMVGDAGYFMRCMRYIELNPVDARMVCRPEDYGWSSYRANAGLAELSWIQPHPDFLHFADDDAARHQSYRAFVSIPPSDEERRAIESAVKGGFAWGGEDFLRMVEAEFGTDAVRKRGRLRPDDD